MTKPRNVLVIFFQENNPRVFDDWFDFADFVKQQNSRGIVVPITRWTYAPTRGEGPDILDN